MLLLDTDLIRSDLRQSGFSEKDIEDTASRFKIYEGIEVRLYVDSFHGYIVGLYNYMVIPRTWCRLKEDEDAK